MKKVAEYVSGPFGNDWARGCPKCKFGIVSAPEFTGACERYLERLVQAVDGDITFCDCQAGTRYRVYLANRFLLLMDEVKKKGNLAKWIGRKTHPDIETAREAMHRGYSYAKPPTMRFVDKAQVPEPELEPVA